ncbi:MATE family efflux transporter, partial [Flavobacteriaceae bacterium (ex Bugula neritina AB1)]
MSANLILDSQKEAILKQPITGMMWKLSWPAILAMVFFGLNTFLDAVFVGHLLGERALSGVALAYPLTSLMLGLGSWVGTGAANLLSIALGANDKITQKNLLGTGSVLSLIVSIVFAIPVYFVAESLIKIMGGEGQILVLGTSYFRVTLFGAFFWVYALLLNFIIRGEGRMKQAAFMMLFGLVMNIILNPIFIIVLELGVEGAAWATNIGMIVYAMVGFVYFKNGRASFKAEVTNVKYNKELGKKIIQSGMPAMIMTIMMLVQSIVVFNAISNYGDHKDLAFYAAANRIYFFMLAPLFGLMRALQPAIGINFGAQNNDRVSKSFWNFSWTGFLILLPFTLAILVFPEQSLKIMLPEMVFNSQDIFMFRIYVAIIPFLSFVFMALSFFPAINKSNLASLLALSRQLLLFVPLVLLLPKYIGVSGVYYASSGIDIVVILVTIV